MRSPDRPRRGLPGVAPRSPGSPLPASLIRVPSLTPAGMLTRRRLTERCAPVPAHVGQGSSMTVPEPPQFEQGWEIEKTPWLWGLDTAAVADRTDARSWFPAWRPCHDRSDKAWEVGNRQRHLGAVHGPDRSSAEPRSPGRGRVPPAPVGSPPRTPPARCRHRPPRRRCSTGCPPKPTGDVGRCQSPGRSPG